MARPDLHAAEADPTPLFDGRLVRFGHSLSISGRPRRLWFLRRLRQALWPVEGGKAHPLCTADRGIARIGAGKPGIDFMGSFGKRHAFGKALPQGVAMFGGPVDLHGVIFPVDGAAPSRDNFRYA